jgi:tripartite-type tricarboxylate transporter receptor subunit TctC
MRLWKTCALLLLLLLTPAFAQSNFPEKSVRLIVGYSPGSAPDIVARLLGERLADHWGKPVVVENITGGGGNIAAERVAKAAPDGYTLLLTGNANMVINPGLYEKLSYDPLKDFAPISQIAVTPNVLVVRNTLPVQSVAELVSLARSNPGKLTFGSSGTGTSGHLAGELLKSLAQVNIQHVPYRGPPYTDLLGERLDLCFCNIASALPLAREGKLRAIAATSLRRAPSAPELPTIAEQGYPGFDASGWFGLVGPSGTPPEVISRIYAGSAAVLQDPTFRQKFENLGMAVIGNSPVEFAGVIGAELPMWARIIKEAGIKPN